MAHFSQQRLAEHPVQSDCSVPVESDCSVPVQSDPTALYAHNSRNRLLSFCFGNDELLLESGRFLIFRFQSILFWVLLYDTSMLWLLLLYSIRFQTFNMLFSCSSLDFYCSLSRDQSRDVTLCLGVSVLFQCLSFAFMRLLSGYYYYDYVVRAVLRPSWFTEITFWIGLLLSIEVKQLMIIITMIICSMYIICSTLHIFPRLITPLLTLFFCYFVLFHSCCSHAQVFGKALVHEFLNSYSYTEWYLLFF